jgi:O-acetyl-ADP-ribose deacetylase (regulator of RNase III)
VIEAGTGSLLDADTEAIVNTVNCVGVMGKGIALQIRQAYPEIYEEYVRACKERLVRPGKMLFTPTGRLVGPRWIIHFPTKRHWKGRSKIEDIKSGLEALVRDVVARGVESVAVPPLGCGSGGLSWYDVRPLIEAAFEDVPVRVVLFAPGHTPAPAKMPVHTERPKMTRARAMFLRLLGLYGELGYDCSILEAQKLAYFLQQAGEPLKLNFVRARYGPYADNLNHLLRRLDGHYLRGFGDRTRGRYAPLTLEPCALTEATAFLEDDSRATTHVQRLANLICGFETPYGMELLSTIHWLITEDPLRSTDNEALVAAVGRWSDRKRRTFTPEHIEAARNRLVAEGWVLETVRA